MHKSKVGYELNLLEFNDNSEMMMYSTSKGVYQYLFKSCLGNHV